MRKSERIRNLEISVIRLELHVELLASALTNMLESQGMISQTDRLDSGKWYKKTNDTP
jgi:hypothetical protein